MSSTPHANDLVKSHLAEAIKQHFVYDGQDRLTETYSATVGTEHGGQCGKTTYAYVGATLRLSGMKEELSTWDSSWDI